MKMLGIEFYCGNYDELRRMKELGGVETHCSRCKLINEQDLVKLLLCFYRFTALPRGKVRERERERVFYLPSTYPTFTPQALRALRSNRIRVRGMRDIQSVRDKLSHGASRPHV